MRCKSLWAGGAALVFLALAAPGTLQAAPKDYPTEALADYVFGCMASNGETQDALRRCSCSIDAIAAKLPYDEYVQAETVLRMQRMPGGNDQAALFRGSAFARTMVDKLREAQVEADLHCF